MKNCQNCKLKHNCFYRGIINPCTDWRADESIKVLQAKVTACKGKQMDFWEGRFLNSMRSRQTYTIPMATIIEQIHGR